MFPVLYTLGNFNVYSFGLFTAVAFILSTFVIWKLAKDEFKEEEFLDVYFYTVLVSLITARFVYIIRNWSEFQFLILKYFLVIETPGLSLLGGALGGFIFLFFYARNRKIEIFHVADLFSIAASLALTFIKIGQQLSGAAFGAQTNFPLKVKIAGRPGFYHPAELYESIIYLILFAVLFYLYNKAEKKKWASGVITAVFAIIVSLSTILLEFIKVYRVYLYGLSFRQILGVLILLAAFVFLGSRLKLFNKYSHYFKKNKK